MTQLTKIQIAGYRNYKELTINLTNKALIIGSNDIGKTNLVHAIRLLLDRSISEAALEPLDSDFCVYCDSNSIAITLTFKDVDDCIKSRMRDFVSDDGTLCVRYEASRDPSSGQKTYQIKASRSEDEYNFQELASRTYLRSLHMRYISSRRDLSAFIRKERQNLFEEARKTRTAEQIDADSTRMGRIKELLSGISIETNELTYIKTVSTRLNAELSKLSYHHTSQTTELSAANTNADTFINNIELVSKKHDKALPVSGDGRTNQVHFALWATKMTPSLSDDDVPPSEIVILCIEEPEAHLHPHQQRRLSAYLANVSPGQVVMTSHSPQIASEFRVDSIVRLVATSDGTSVAGEGCNVAHQDNSIELGYRIGLLTSEALFSSGVFLVEGPSERIFFMALLRQLGIDIDRENITILTVEGVSFASFATYLRSFRVPFSARTDNDVQRLSNSSQNHYYLPGVERLLNLSDDSALNALRQEFEGMSRFADQIPPSAVIDCVQRLRPALADNGLFLSERDLETDIYPIFSESLQLHFGTTDDANTIKKMKTRKAINMFEWVTSWITSQHSQLILDSIANHSENIESLIKPISFLRSLISGAQNGGDSE